MEVMFEVRADERAELERIYKAEGLTLTGAVQLFFDYTRELGKMPFDAANLETEAAVQEAREIMSGEKRVKNYKSARELFDELDAEIELEDNVGI